TIRMYNLTLTDFLLQTRDLLVLVSFPTRRSSDPQRLVRTIATAGTGALALVRRRDVVADNEHLLRLGTALADAGLTWLTGSDPQDRKSTRLNSSHVSISYDVFCLNNKKKEIREWR